MKNNRITSRERLGHILDSISSIESFLAGYDRSSFLDDRKTIDATLFQFAVIGEAIIRVDQEILDTMISHGIKSEHSGILFSTNTMQLKTESSGIPSGRISLY